MIINHLLSDASLVAGVVSIVICTKYGLNKCESYKIDFLRHDCNYTINFRENHHLAVLEIAFLCAATALTLPVAMVTGWCLRILRHRPCTSHSGCCCCLYSLESRCCRNEDSGVQGTNEEMRTFNTQPPERVT